MRVEYGDGFAHIAVEHIYVNGRQLRHCIMADDELGTAVIVKTNERGEVVHIGGNLCKTEVPGKVEIVFKQCWGMNEQGNYVFKRGRIDRVYKKKEINNLR